MKCSVIILAAGSGKRTGLQYNKVLYEIHGKKLIEYSIDKFKEFPLINEIVLVVSQNELEYFQNNYNDKVDNIVVGGKERQDSLYNALQIIKNDYVLVHDGARPFIPTHSMRELFSLLENEKSLTLAVKVKDTIQRVRNNKVIETLNREELYAVQTPQAFKKETLMKAHSLAKKDGFVGTDDTMLVEKYLNIPTHIIKGDYRNLKLTTIDDIKLLEVILCLE
jgi:2-C-methyl-D-erythritol 4-phosphate cytidylyltransferase